MSNFGFLAASPAVTVDPRGGFYLTVPPPTRGP
jgi:hypothetical protein